MIMRSLPFAAGLLLFALLSSPLGDRPCWPR